MLAGCSAQEEPYESRREKTPDMQDAKILASKSETSSVADDPVTEPAETETTEEPDEEQTEETTEPVAEPDDEDTVELFGYLNMREGSGVEYDIVTLLKEGDTLTILGEVISHDATWYRVEYDDESGYVEEETLQAVVQPQE